MALELDSSRIKAKFSELTGRVAHTRERLVVLRHGRPYVAVVPIEDLRRLEASDAAEKAMPEAPKEHPIMQVYGGWADSPELDEIMEEIIRARHATPPTDTQIWD